MRTHRRIAAVVVFVVGSVVFGACRGGDRTQQSSSAPQAKPTDVIRIGVAGPFTGSAAAFGEQIRMGAELARDQVNERGGIGGVSVEMVFEDDQGRDDQANIVATKLATDPMVSAVIGHFNSICSAAGKAIYKQFGVVEFSPGSTNVDICKGSDWTFRNLYHDGYQGQSLARYIKDVLGLESAAIFYDNDDYGSGLKNAFVADAERLGIEIVGEEAFQREATLDFSPAIDKFASQNPDIIFIAGLYNEAASIVKQAREKGVATQFIGGDGLYSPDLIENGGEAVEGLLLTTPFIVHPDIGGPVAQSFRTAFREKFDGQDPDTWAALTYDAANQLFDVIGRVGSDRTAIRDALAAMTTPETAYAGVTGRTYFDENGDCLKPAYVAVVRDGEFAPAAEQIPAL
ncbi:branched chain amino acid ABC transporter substrate-binding protein [Candidatus Poribacteria bacterium]|nr:branched chain amino acid ABC transporter substrate-binding protein [Candidatus Poribacteria bacterium]